jgi:hypothetical protein
MNHERVRPSSAVRASVSSDGLVLLDVDGGQVLSANGVGARIWQLIEQESSTTEIAERVAIEYEIPREQATRDVLSFVADLMARRLVAGDVRR